MNRSSGFLRVILIIAVSISVTFLVIKLYFLNKEVEILRGVATEKTQQLKDLGANEQPAWKSVELPAILESAPSLLTIRQKESPQTATCLSVPMDSFPYERIKKEIAPYTDLVNGIKEIENYTYTMNLVDEAGNALPAVQSKQNISYTAVCQTGERAYAVLFLTTGAAQDKQLLSIPEAHAAGGWLGDSNLAVIEGGKTTIYEKFTGVAKHIRLRNVNGDPELLRFGAYYNCNKISILTDQSIVISCHGNTYAFDHAEHSFRELAICGAVVRDGSYMTSTMACYDESGSRFYLRDDTVLPQ